MLGKLRTPDKTGEKFKNLRVVILAKPADFVAFDIKKSTLGECLF